MRLRCMCLMLHAATDLRLEEMDAGETGPGEVLVRVGMGGICGSDLHYFRHGGFGAIRLQQPMVLGHEVAGTVVTAAADVTSVQVGDRVAVTPSRPCGSCRTVWKACRTSASTCATTAVRCACRMCKGRSAMCCCARPSNASRWRTVWR